MPRALRLAAFLSIAADAHAATTSCFLTQDLAGTAIHRGPDDDCDARSAPASTFKIPHALAALDAGVVTDDEVMPYDGDGSGPASWQRDHTLASAMRHSVVWYFQRIAERLGPARERDYLQRYDYGNREVSDDVTTFWLGTPLAISPLEQLAFLRRLYRDELPVSAEAASIVKAALVQPANTVWNARGEHAFAAPWPDGTTVSAKTGSATGVRWLVGRVQRGDRDVLFVARVRGEDATLAPNAAIDLAAEELRRRGVLQGE